jgi:hypothetical protein
LGACRFDLVESPARLRTAGIAIFRKAVARFDREALCQGSDRSQTGRGLFLQRGRQMLIALAHEMSGLRQKT